MKNFVEENGIRYEIEDEKFLPFVPLFPFGKEIFGTRIVKRRTGVEEFVWKNQIKFDWTKKDFERMVRLGAFE